MLFQYFSFHILMHVHAHSILTICVLSFLFSGKQKVYCIEFRQWILALLSSCYYVVTSSLLCKGFCISTILLNDNSRFIFEVFSIILYVNQHIKVIILRIKLLHIWFRNSDYKLKFLYDVDRGILYEEHTRIYKFIYTCYWQSSCWIINFLLW